MNALHSIFHRRVASLVFVAAWAACTACTGPAGRRPQEAPRAPVPFPSLGALAAQDAGSLLARDPSAGEKPATAAAAAAPMPEPLLPGLSGWSKTRYRLRTVDGDADHDLYEVLGLDYVEPTEKKLEAHFLGRAALDLDGDGASQLQSINDTGSGSLDADLYEAYVKRSFHDGDWSVRLGRASEYLTPEVAHYDGASFSGRIRGAQGVEFGAYGGRNVVFDLANDDDGFVAGAFAAARPWKGGRARLDWMHLEDEDLLGDDQDDLAGLSLWQQWRAWSVSGAYTRLEDRDRDVELRGRWSDAAGRTSVALRYFELLDTQNQRALFLDPFLQALQTFFPYRQFGAHALRAVSENLDVDAGFDVREVEDASDVGTFNHDWRRYYGALTLREFVASAFTLTLNADYYDDDRSDVQAFGGSLSRELTGGFDASLGTYYSRYKYDLFTASERDDVQTWFGKLVWRRSQSWTFELLYEYEDDDLDEYHTLRCGALCRF
ncbi:MAG: hypothetical protein IPK67_04780 [Planctomycetes bacterium]|nr:hypothetical protein [Planctomycetota bacterium]